MTIILHGFGLTDNKTSIRVWSLVSCLYLSNILQLSQLWIQFIIVQFVKWYIICLILPENTRDWYNSLHTSTWVHINLLQVQLTMWYIFKNVIPKGVNGQFPQVYTLLWSFNWYFWLLDKIHLLPSITNC